MKHVTSSNNVVYSLYTDKKGLGLSTTIKITSSLGIQKNFKKKDLANYFAEGLDQKFLILSTPIETNYIESRKAFLKKAKNMGNYRARRLLQSLPARGQRTKSNARTQKDKRPSSVQQLRTAFKRKIRKGSSKRSANTSTLRSLKTLYSPDPLLNSCTSRKI